MDIIETLETYLSHTQYMLVKDIWESLQVLYTEYDPGILNEILALSVGCNATNDEYCDKIVTCLTADVIGVLNQHGIILTDTAHLSTLTALAQCIWILPNIDESNDIEDILSVIHDNDNVEAVAILAATVATHPIEGNSFDANTIQHDIERVDNTFITLVDRTMNNEVVFDPLSEPMQRFIKKFPDNLLSHMLQFPRMIMTGGDIRMYTTVYDKQLHEDSKTICEYCVGIILCANIPQVNIIEELDELLDKYISVADLPAATLTAHTLIKGLL